VLKRRTGAVLSFGPSWESAWPVAFESRPLKGAELNYPVHEQEMLSIVRALKKWKTDLIGAHITICTNHKTLENFDSQKELLRRQARWMEFLAQFEYSFSYISGPNNTVADALSWLPERADETDMIIGAIFTIQDDADTVRTIHEGYEKDSWCTGLLEDTQKRLINPKLGVELRDRLLWIKDKLIIPCYSDLREKLF
jgi:hypothetical protein